MPVGFRCPHCRQPLEAVSGATLRCAEGHSFDRAREGYVNLLPAGRKRGRPPGDSAEMIAARRAFLDSGAYAPVVDAVAAMAASSVARAGGGEAAVLDAGCGEGTYLAAAIAAVAAAGEACEAGERASGWGIDVSKPAVRLAARRHRACTFAVASAYVLPFAAGSFAAVLTVFAPRPFAELERVLVPGGSVVVASPGPDHLVGLTGALYGAPRAHGQKPHAAEGEGPHAPAERQRVRYELGVEGGAIGALLQMTPYWWRADPAQRHAVLGRERLETVVDVVVARHERAAS